jgi:RNA polymerase sigma-70 factor (ECF subfamily)
MSSPLHAGNAPPPVLAPPDDDPLIARVRGGDLTAFELLMRRHNQKLFRTIRAVLRDGNEIEDVMQDTYLAAFKHLPQFEGRARFSTWLLKIGIHEAFARLRQRLPVVDVAARSEEEPLMINQSVPPPTPEEQASRHQLIAIVEGALDGLPSDARQILMLRTVESLETAEVADILGLSEAAVKQRLHRARALLQERVQGQLDGALPSAFGFLGARCDRVVAGVLARVGGD